MDADRALGGQRDVALAADRAAGRCDEDARERGVGVVIGRRGEPERFGSKAGEADIAVRAQFNAAGKNAFRRDARRAKDDLAGPRSATRRSDHDAAARDRKSVESGKRVSVHVALGGRGIHKKKHQTSEKMLYYA